MAEKNKTKIYQSELGASGISLVNGQPESTESNPNFAYLDTISLYREMRDTMPIISAVMNAIKMSFVQTAFYFEPASDDKKDIEIKDFLEDVFFKEIDWSDFISQASLMMDYGYMFFEIVEFVRDGKVYYKKIAPRLPGSDDEMYYNKDRSEVGIKQKVYIDDSYVNIDIPPEKIFRLTINREGDNFRGRSVMRPMYMPFTFLKKLYKESIISAQRSAGIPEIINDSTTITPDEESKIKEAAKNIVNDCDSYLYHNRDQEFKYFVNPNNFDYVSLINVYESLILKTVLAQFLDISKEGNSGGYAQSKSEITFFLMFINSFLDYFTRRVNSVLVKRSVHLNFGDAPAPKLKYNNPSDESIDSIINRIKLLVDSKIITNNFELENIVRQKLDLPDIEKADEKNRDDDSGDSGDSDDKVNTEKDDTDLSLKSHDKLKLSEPRALTLAERRVNIAKFNQFLDKNEDSLKKNIKTSLNEYIQWLINASYQFAKTGVFPVVPPKFTQQKNSLKSNLNTAFNEFVEFGKTEASNEMGVDRSKVDSSSKKIVKVTSSSVADDLFLDLKTAAALSAANGLKGKGTPREIKNFISDSLEKKIDQKSNTISSVNTIGMVNLGRNNAFDDNEDDIWGYTYSAVLDDVTTNMCKSLDGRTVRKKSELPDPPLHLNCRSIIVSILKDELEKPEINKPPKSIVDNISADIFQNKDIKNPFIKKDSRAARVYR